MRRALDVVATLTVTYMPPCLSIWFRFTLLLMGSLTTTSCTSVFFSGINAASSRAGVIERPNQVFDSSHGLSLDVYQPQGASDAPIVVFFYGGTWKRGKRTNYRWVGRSLARQGIVAIVADYRKYPQVGLQGFMSDVAGATAWAYRHGHDYGGDPKRLAVMGHSAGAHLAVLLGTDSHWLNEQGMTPRELCGVVGLAGPYKFLPLTDPELMEIFSDTAAAADPISHVDGDEPPMLLLHGADDKVVAPRNSIALQAALQRADGAGLLKLYPHVGHIRLILSLRKPMAHSPVLNDTVQFLRQCRAH
ncbi:esterase/lipase/thioesterase [Xanthomonas fragariae]|uniref:Carboxylesterase NlhH n=2 Tax=Xanthomonas fragariae TaxID=48664 RepID=A0A1Y6HBX2_9XANT|nr:Carboxylesterase NlhH [Xanthomonas fragariae]SMR03792.1 esterase/lipase/thioesterase [Xanthomonas fragariae]